MVDIKQQHAKIRTVINASGRCARVELPNTVLTFTAEQAAEFIKAIANAAGLQIAIVDLS